MTATFAAIILAWLLSDPSDASGDDALRLTNVTVLMSRSGGPGSRIEAKISNPNDFAVYDVVATCDVKDRRNTAISSSAITVPDAVLSKTTRIIRNFTVEAWPQQARTAECISQQAKRFPN
jgi:hypothetical protein